MRRIAMMFLLLLAASSMSAGSLTLAEYEAALTRMRTFIEAGQVDAARAGAPSGKRKLRSPAWPCAGRMLSPS